MAEQSQQDFLKTVKGELGVTWEELSDIIGVKYRAIKTYRMPEGSKDHREMKAMVRGHIERKVSEYKEANEVP